MDNEQLEADAINNATVRATSFAPEIAGPPGIVRADENSS
jgi:hypothetical protein